MYIRVANVYIQLASIVMHVSDYIVIIQSSQNMHQPHRHNTMVIEIAIDITEVLQ